MNHHSSRVQGSAYIFFGGGVQDNVPAMIDVAGTINFSTLLTF